MKAAVVLSVAEFKEQAAKAASLLRAMANEQRLLVLCHLAVSGELPAGALVEATGLSQSALSQHLARLRDEGLITFRRESQSLIYRIADPNAERVLDLLKRMYCPDLGAEAFSG